MIPRLRLAAAAAPLVLAAALSLPSGGGPAAAARGTAAAPVLLAEPEPAVGRVNHAGYRRRRHCTAFAVAPRVAVTAAHCIAGVDPRDMHLLFGYARMEWLVHATPAEAHDLGGDVAVLCLSGKAPATLAVAEHPPGRGDVVRVVGYGRPRVHAPSAAACTVAAVDGSGIVLDCPQSRGASGGPVLDAAGAVVAVMSRTAPASSVASALPADAAGHCP